MSRLQRGYTRVVFFLLYLTHEKTILILLLVLCLSITTGWAKHLYTEREYQKYWCTKYKGIMEYKLNDKTRVDCLLPEIAVEVDFAPKWLFVSYSPFC